MHAILSLLTSCYLWWPQNQLGFPAKAEDIRDLKERGLFDEDVRRLWRYKTAFNEVKASKEEEQRSMGRDMSNVRPTQRQVEKHLGLHLMDEDGERGRGHGNLWYHWRKDRVKAMFAPLVFLKQSAVQGEYSIDDWVRLAPFVHSVCSNSCFLLASGLTSDGGIQPDKGHPFTVGQ